MNANAIVSRLNSASGASGARTTFSDVSIGEMCNATQDIPSTAAHALIRNLAQPEESQTKFSVVGVDEMCNATQDRTITLGAAVGVS